VGVEAEGGDPAADGFEDGVDGDDGEDHREHLEDEEAAEEFFAAEEFHAGEGVGAGGGQHQDEEGAGGGHLDRVPEPAQDGDGGREPGAVGLLHGQAEDHAPMVEAEGVGGGQEAAGGEVALAERNGDHHEQRHHHEGDEAGEHGMGEQEPPAIGLAFDHQRPPFRGGGDGAAGGEAELLPGEQGHHDEQEGGDGGGEAEARRGILERHAEGVGDEQVRGAGDGGGADDVGLAAGEQVDEREIVEVEGEAGDEQREQRREDLREGDLPEVGPGAGAVDGGGFVELVGHGLEHAGGDDHHVGIAQPGVDDQDHGAGEGGIGEPLGGDAEEGGQDEVDFAVAFVEEALEDEDGDEGGDGVGQDEQRAVEGASAQGLPLEQAGQHDADGEGDGDGQEGEGHVPAEDLQEGRADGGVAEDEAEVLPADPDAPAGADGFAGLHVDVVAARRVGHEGLAGDGVDEGFAVLVPERQAVAKRAEADEAQGRVEPGG
jgi:hypothetical protein